MPKESVITDSMVGKVALDWRGQDPSLTGYASLEAVTAILAQLANLPASRVFLIDGCAHELVLPHPANPEQGTRWFPDLAGGGKLELVLARVDERAQQVHFEYHAFKQQGRVDLDEPESWLLAHFNPTTTPMGNNLMPVTIPDPDTGEIDEVPSSSPRFLTAAYRMGYHLLPELARQAGLTNGEVFSDRTLRSIKNGDIHVVRSQWAAYLPADIRAFLQLLVVLYDQTIADKQGIIQLAEHLRLTFKRFPPEAARALTGVMLQRRQGNKKQYSISFYDKAVEVARMRQGRTLTRLEATTVRSHVRLDMTVHSAGVLTLVGEARRRLPQLLQKRPKYLDAKSAQRFLTEAPRSTVWWLERAVWILSHTTTPDCSRESFGSWLIPEMLSEVLRLDCIAGFTTADLDAVTQQQGDEVITAWCTTARVEDDWAGALAQAAGCSKGWVYERRKHLLAKYKIDIEIPFAFYRDLVFFGPNSLTKPKVRAALNAALARGDAATNLRLRQKAVKDFDRRRISVVGGTVRSPPLLMSPKVAIPTKDLGYDQSGVGLVIQSVAPRASAADAVKVRRSAGSVGALNLSGSAPVAARGHGGDVRQAAPAKPVTNPSQGHEEVHRSVRLRWAVHPASSGQAEIGLRRPKVVLHDVPGGRKVKKTLRVWMAPKPAPPSDVIARSGSEASKLEPARRRLAVHSIVRDPPGVGRKRVMVLRLKPRAP